MKAATAAGISDRSARRWMKRWREEGEPGRSDRSSAPHRIPHKTPPEQVAEVVRRRRLRMTAAQIALALTKAVTLKGGSYRLIGVGRLLLAALAGDAVTRLQDPAELLERRRGQLTGPAALVAVRWLGR